MIKLIFISLVTIITSIIPLDSEYQFHEIQSNNPIEYSVCGSLFYDLAIGNIDFEEYNMLLGRCSISLDCPEGADYGSVGCSGPASGECSSDEDSVTCSGHTTSCYCTGTELCEN